jgi:oxidase EvaA
LNRWQPYRIIVKVQIINSTTELDALMQGVIAGAGFQIEQVALQATEDWTVREGALSHRTGGFFDVMGLEDAAGAEHLLMYQPQSALTGLAYCKIANQIHVLLQARIEPGNTGIGQWGPTIQSTPANFLALHGGKPTPGLELFYQFNPGALPVGTSVQLDLGERYFQKSKWHNYVLLDEPVAMPAHMAWVSLSAIASVLDRDNCLNADLRSLLAVFNWDKLASRKLGRERERGRERGRGAELLGALNERRRTYSVDYRLKAVGEMRDWEVTPVGIEPRNDSKRISARMYHTSCGTREVKAWFQPMIVAPSRGRVTLQVADGQCLLQVRREMGIEGGYVLTASEIINPGESVPDSHEDVLASFVQSDEGGRFYRHETTYRLVRGNPTEPVAVHMAWVPLETLKDALALSNVASFQLRCIASLLIPEMNPSLSDLMR